MNTCTTNSLSLGLWTSLWGITIFTGELKPTNCVRAVWRAVMTASYVYHFSWYVNWRESRSAGMAALMRTRMSLSKHLFIVGLEQVGDSQWGSSFDLFFGQTFCSGFRKMSVSVFPRTCLHDNPHIGRDLDHWLPAGQLLDQPTYPLDASSFLLEHSSVPKTTVVRSKAVIRWGL